MVDDGYATSADVDTAMTLGCGYPRGPIRLLADAGVGAAVDVLRAMHAGYGDPAFAPPPLMTEYAQGGLSPVVHQPAAGHELPAAGEPAEGAAPARRGAAPSAPGRPHAASGRPGSG